MSSSLKEVEVFLSCDWENPFLPEQSGCWKESTWTNAALSLHLRVCIFIFRSSPLETYMLSFIFKCSVGKLELKQVLNFQKAQPPSTDTTFVKMLSILFSVAAARPPGGSQRCSRICFLQIEAPSASSAVEGKGHLAFLPLTPAPIILSDVKVRCG